MAAFGHTFARLLPAFSEAGFRRGKKEDSARIWDGFGEQGCGQRDARWSALAGMLMSGGMREADLRNLLPGRGRHVSVLDLPRRGPLHAGARRI